MYLYGDRFAFYLVEADADISIADAKRRVETMEIKAPFRLDPEHRLALLTKAKTTPEAVKPHAERDQPGK
jgi:hypothetical protein